MEGSEHPLKIFHCDVFDAVLPERGKELMMKCENTAWLVVGMALLPRLLHLESLPPHHKTCVHDVQLLVPLHQIGELHVDEERLCHLVCDRMRDLLRQPVEAVVVGNSGEEGPECCLLLPFISFGVRRST